ncbi:hypothetical protein OAM67_00860 [bacterium]|nr:hypothetical protein [bacterium]
MSSGDTKAKIAAFSLVPAGLSLGGAALAFYMMRRKTALGARWKDGLVWGGGLLLAFVLAIAFMYVPVDFKWSDDAEMKAQVAGFSMVPFMLVLACMAAAFYGMMKKGETMTGSWMKDGGVWVGALAVYFLLSFAFMFVPIQFSGLGHLSDFYPPLDNEE